MKNTGSSLEKIILASQRNIVTLTQIPSGVRWVGKGRTVPVSAPVDFFGGFVGSGRLLVFDAKSDGNAKSLNTSDTHLKPHQRAELVRYADAGFIAGILAESTKAKHFYWLSAAELAIYRKSMPWEAMLDLGPTAYGVQFERLARAYGMFSKLDFTPAVGEPIYPEAK